MNVVIVLMSLVSVCLSFQPSQQRRQTYLSREEAESSVSIALKSLHSMYSKRQTRQTSRRPKTDPDEKAFRLIDVNNDGRISADEFSTFYFENSWMTGLYYTKDEWKEMFNVVAPLVDMNGTPQTLEFDET